MSSNPLDRTTLYSVSDSLSFRSPALKPFWRHLVGTDAENLFSSLFKRLFCDSSAHYRDGYRYVKKVG